MLASPRAIGISASSTASTRQCGIPSVDPFLPATFDVSDLSGKRVCKRALLQRFELAQGDDAMARPVIGLVSRLVEQKGLDLIEAASDALVETDATWVFVGTGEARYEAVSSPARRAASVARRRVHRLR